MAIASTFRSPTRWAHRPFGLGFVERQQHRALVVDALGHAAHRIFRNQRRRPIARHRMLDPVLRLAGPASVGAAGDEDRVLEAAGRNQPGRRAAAGQQRVVDHGRAVHEEVGPGEQLLDAQVHLPRRDGDGIEHAAGEVRRRRQGLAHDEGLAGGDNDGIGTGAADIGRHDKAYFSGICVHEAVSVFRRCRRMPDSFLQAWPSGLNRATQRRRARSVRLSDRGAGMKFPFALRDVAYRPAGRFAESLRKRRRGERDGGRFVRLDLADRCHIDARSYRSPV